MNILIDHFVKINGNDGFDQVIIGFVGAKLANPMQMLSRAMENALFSLEISPFVIDRNLRNFFSRRFIKNEVAIPQLRQDPTNRTKGGVAASGHIEVETSSSPRGPARSINLWND